MATNTSPIHTAIILAAGKGTRMGALTAHGPKCLVLIHERPLLYYAIERLIAVHIQRVIIVVEHYAEQVERAVLQFPHTNQSIECVQQSTVVGQRYGTAAAIQAASARLTGIESALIVSGDSLYSVQSLQQCVQATQAQMMVSMQSSVKGFGEVILDDFGYVQRIIEKPTIDHPGCINLGSYVAPAELIRMFSQASVSARNEYECTDVLNAYAAQFPLYAQLIDSTEWTTVTSAEDVKRVETYVAKT